VKRETKQTSIRIDERDLLKLKEMAAREQLDVSDIIRRAIRKEVETK
jgi:hypothetical protein